MRKGSKVFWLLVSIAFAVGAVAVGSMYDNRRKRELELTTEKTIQTPTKETKKESKNNTGTLESTNISEEGSETFESGTLNSVDEANTTQSELAAQELINLIIVEGQVQSNFTLDDYYAAKAAVDPLPESPKKQDLMAQISQIQTALTNMGISY